MLLNSTQPLAERMRPTRLDELVGQEHLTGPNGETLAHDKGYGERDKMAEWIMTEIRAKSGLAYIQKHAPFVFGIRLAIPNA